MKTLGNYDKKKFLFSHAVFSKRLEQLNEELEDKKGSAYPDTRIVREIKRKYGYEFCSATLGKYKRASTDYSGDEGEDIKNYPSPTLNNLVALADFYNVSIDYLVGRSKSKSSNPTKMFIGDNYGLSNESLSSLSEYLKGHKKLNQYQAPFSITEVVQRIILNKDFLQKMSYYFFERFIRDSEPSSYKEKHQNEIEMGLFTAREFLIDAFRKFVDNAYEELIKKSPTREDI